MLLQKKILIVEDNEINRFTLRVILSPEYTVLEAEDGEQALCLTSSCLSWMVTHS